MGVHEAIAARVRIDPIGFTEEEALAFTGVGEAQLRAWRKAKTVRFLPRGPRGALITTREQLEKAMAELFSNTSDDWDFGDD